MKIALVTIHKANNYGALLQAYALQEVLKSFGEVDLVDYDNEYLSVTLNPVRFVWTFHGLLGMGKDLCRLFPRYRLVNKFKKFMSERFAMTATYKQSELLANKLAGYDCYVVGSDQVWNPACVSLKALLDPVYFLEFAPEGARKISYASSVGGYVYSDQEEVEVKKYLNSFSSVSVREKNTQQYLTNLGIKEVEHVLDPTLLLDIGQWEALIKKSPSTEPYILLYSVPKSSLVRPAVDYFSKKLGLKVIAIDQDLVANAQVDTHLRDAGPEDLLSLFASAAFVVTDSFHGVCFSINFERPFVSLTPGVHVNRVESLLSLVGLSDQYVRNESEFSNISLNIDFTEPRARLKEAREASLHFLKTAVS
ncbi:polysaccharide pyruvyl transferase family protein [Methylomicrobium lacus]|uniref:polysaccharide pyruvyl transferase family protein n=1 Tax=Methylomicrobium lacus TaxID=136992 RepID=UPI0035A8B95D